ncbi:N-acetylglucosaminyl phosphatidylinositol deacetylase-related [Candidatus Nanopelagicaceae bacterium]
MLSRRKVVAGLAGLFLTNAMGGQSAQALTKKKSSSKVKPVTHSVTKPEPVLPSTLDSSVLTSRTKQVVFYAPHPDDELLSFGVIASEYIALGYEVIYVLLTSGSTSTAIKLINGELASPGNGTRFVYKGMHNPSISGYAPLSIEDIGRARVTEFKSSAGEMNVPPQRIHTLNLLKENELHTEDVVGAMLEIVALYPQAIHWTMSTIDIHPHHRAAGESLRLIAEGTELLTGYSISRTTWDALTAERARMNATLPTTYLFKPSTDRMQRVRNAALPYNAWNPQAGSFAVGYTSVPKQFEDLDTKSDAQYSITAPTLESVKGWIPSI